VKRKESTWNARITVAALSLIAFPLLAIIAFYASSTLVPSMEKFQFAVPTQTASTTVSIHTIHRLLFNGTLPPALNFPLPKIPSITFADIIFLIAVIVISYACLQSFRLIINRRTIKPLADIDALVEERNKVATILDETVRKLSLGSNYRDTVLKCYKLIAESLEAKLSLDGKALTATEFMKTISLKLKFDSVNLSRATSLFEVARYSQDEITQENASEAIKCLSALGEELRAKNLVISKS